MNQILLSCCLAAMLSACASKPNPLDFKPSGFGQEPNYEQDEEGFLDYYLEIFSLD